MSLSQNKPDIVSERQIFTQYPVEEFTFTWKVTNFSKIFSAVCAQFKTYSGATMWELKLQQSQILLYRCFRGRETVRVHCICSLFTKEEILKYEADYVYKDFGNSFLIMCFDHYDTHFENDVFKFKCTLKILGHTITNEIKSSASAITNFKELSIDMRDLFEKQEHCDLTMTVGKDKIRVHKSILCARSPVFNKMFQCTMLEAESKEIQINDMDFNVLKDFLVFLYSGDLGELRWNSAFQLYYAADKYEIISLRETCSDFLGLNLEVDNVCDVLKLADMHRDEKLKISAINYAQIHSSALKSTENWQEFLKTHPRLAVEIFK